jgi:hypothetical protein
MDSAMSIETGDVALAAEVLAVKTLIGQVLGRVHQLDPILAEAIQGGFEDAGNKIRRMAARSRKTVNADQAVRALSTIETLQAAVLGRSHRRVRPSVANDNE